MAVALKSYPLFVIKQWQNRNFIFYVLHKNQCTLNGVLNSYEKGMTSAEIKMITGFTIQKIDGVSQYMLMAQDIEKVINEKLSEK